MTLQAETDSAAGCFCPDEKVETASLSEVMAASMLLTLATRVLRRARVVASVVIILNLFWVKLGCKAS